ncbi:cytochrome c peroxidase [Maricaulis sp.]|uniref:cytochrome c peroxidase n=1 Tax=Maricaulis sp. TaxID=1486257 RepID=UPI0026103206|nr:cytochrome c peroxidase [Maricaulis sp.]
MFVSSAMCLLLAACGGGGGDSSSGTTGGGSQVANAAPIVSVANLDQSARVGEAFTYDATQSGQTFSDPDGDALTYSIAITPANIGLDANGGTISGTPDTVVEAIVTITARDPMGATASDSFSIFIQANQDVKALSGQVGLRFVTGQSITFDPASWSDYFEDPSGNRLEFEITLDTTIPGLAVVNDRLEGIASSAGVFSGVITASNGAGSDAVLPIRIVIIRGTTIGAPVLPATPVDYVALAEEDLPLHFLQPVNGGNSIAARDNTPNNNPLTNAGATLGRVLFYDTRLSVNNTVSCASCHVQAFSFGEPSRFSRGFDGQLTPVNAPHLANVRFYDRGNMFWDERAASLEEQALGPIVSPVEMGNTLENVVAAVEAQSFYPPLFTAAFGDDTVTSDRIARALAQFQRAMVSAGSSFDTARIGDDPNADTPDFAGRFTQQELHGMALFMPIDDALLAQAGLGPVQSMGCNQCHQTDAHVLNRPPQNIGLDPTVSGGGATGDDDFKVPSLRNIALTAPFMHDGRFETLEEVVEFYATGVNDNGETSNLLRQGNNAGAPIQRFNLDDDEIAALVAFLHTLTDESFVTEDAFSDPFDE